MLLTPSMALTPLLSLILLALSLVLGVPLTLTLAPILSLILCLYLYLYLNPTRCAPSRRAVAVRRRRSC